MKVKVLAGHVNFYLRNQVHLRYLRSLICVTKSCKPCVFKKEKKVKRIIYVLLNGDAICRLTVIAHTAYVFFLHY